MHGRYYAQAWGSGADFEIQIARDASGFVERYDSACDLILSALVDGEIVGCLSVLGAHPGPEGPQLRFFIVDPRHHGHGIGTALLTAALAWCRERGFRRAFLWTVDHLPQSRHLYEKAGFRIVERCRDDRYTVALENLKMVLSLDPKPGQD